MEKEDEGHQRRKRRHNEFLPSLYIHDFKPTTFQAQQIERVRICIMCAVSNSIIQTSCHVRRDSVQDHPKSKVMVPIDSPCVISYSISIDPIIVSPVLKYLTCNFSDLEPKVKVMTHGANRKPIDGSYLTSIVSNIVSLMAFEIFHVKVL